MKWCSYFSRYDLCFCLYEIFLIHYIFQTDRDVMMYLNGNKRLDAVLSFQPSNDKGPKLELVFQESAVMMISQHLNRKFRDGIDDSWKLLDNVYEHKWNGSVYVKKPKIESYKQDSEMFTYVT